MESLNYQEYELENGGVMGVDRIGKQITLLSFSDSFEGEYTIIIVSDLIKAIGNDLAKMMAKEPGNIVSDLLVACNKATVQLGGPAVERNLVEDMLKAAIKRATD